MFNSIHVIPIACAITAVAALFIGCQKVPEHNGPAVPTKTGVNMRIKALRYDACMKSVPINTSITHLSNSSLNAVHINPDDINHILVQCDNNANAQAICMTSPDDKECIPNGYI